MVCSAKDTLTLHKHRTESFNHFTNRKLQKMLKNSYNLGTFSPFTWTGPSHINQTHVFKQHSQLNFISMMKVLL